jgi:hypothetical protein
MHPNQVYFMLLPHDTSKQSTEISIWSLVCKTLLLYWSIVCYMKCSFWILQILSETISETKTYHPVKAVVTKAYRMSPTHIFICLKIIPIFLICLKEFLHYYMSSGSIFLNSVMKYKLQNWEVHVRTTNSFNCSGV